MVKQNIITIMHTNDLHSHLENWPKIRRYLREQQDELNVASNGVLTVDIGDALDLVHPLTEATAGQANVKLLNQIHYDAVTIGNNEGLSLPHEKLDHLYDYANFPVTVANFHDLKTNKRPKWCHNVIYKAMPDGTNVAMIGLTAPFVDAYPLREWSVFNVEAVLDNLLPKVKEQADIIVLLSHLGLPIDRKLAKKFADLDVIIGAHTHHLLPKGEIIAGTLVAAAGKWGRNIGKVTMVIENHRIIAKHASVITTTELPDIPADGDEIENYFRQGKQALEAEVVANLPQKLLRADGSLLSSLFAMLEDKTGIQAGILSTGLLMHDLPVGMINKADLLTLLPHQMYIMTTKISGHELKRLLLEIHKNAEFISTFSMVGLGFRGKIFGNLEMKGMRIDLSQGEFFYDNELVIDEKIYEFVSLDYYKYLPFFPTIDLAGENKILMQNMLREDFALFLARKYPI